MGFGSFGGSLGWPGGNGLGLVSLGRSGNGSVLVMVMALVVMACGGLVGL